MQLQMAVRSGTSIGPVPATETQRWRPLNWRQANSRRRRPAATALSTSPRIACGCPTAARCSSRSMKQASAEYCIVVITARRRHRRDRGGGVPAGIHRRGRALHRLQIDTFFKPMVVGADPLHHLDNPRQARAHPRLPRGQVADRHRAVGFARQAPRRAGVAAARRRTGQAGAADLGGARQYPRGAGSRKRKRMVLERGYKGLKLKVWKRIRRGRRAGARGAQARSATR